MLLTTAADFASGGAPRISVCSASDMLNLSPSDIVNKLRMFLYLICGLFGGMHLGSLIGHIRDHFGHRHKVRTLFEPGMCGFSAMGPDGAWTWLLDQACARTSGS